MRFSRSVPSGGAVIGGHAGSGNPVQPFTDRLAVVAVRSAGALMAGCSHGGEHEQALYIQGNRQSRRWRRHLAGDRGLAGLSCRRLFVGKVGGHCQFP